MRPLRGRPAPAALLLLLALGCAHGRGAKGEPGSLRLEIARQLVSHRNWPGAFEVLDKLYRDDPSDPEVLALRGVVYRENGLLEEARVELEAAVRLGPEQAFGHAALGVLLDMVGEPAAAERHHRRAAELEPGNAGYLNNLAFSRFAAGRVEEAIAGYEEALRVEPTNARVRNNLGFALARAGRFERAGEQFARAGPPAEARNNLALAHELAGDLPRALELYLQATRLGQGAERAKENLERLARRSGRSLPGAGGAAAPGAPEEGR